MVISVIAIGYIHNKGRGRNRQAIVTSLRDKGGVVGPCGRREAISRVVRAREAFRVTRMARGQGLVTGDRIVVVLVDSLQARPLFGPISLAGFIVRLCFVRGRS